MVNEDEMCNELFKLLFSILYETCTIRKKKMSKDELSYKSPARKALCREKQKLQTLRLYRVKTIELKKNFPLFAPILIFKDQHNLLWVFAKHKHLLFAMFSELLNQESDRQRDLTRFILGI